MLVMNDSTINFNAISQDQTNDTAIASMNASYSGGSGLYFSLNIDDFKTADIEGIETDFHNFITRVIAAVQRTNE